MWALPIGVLVAMYLSDIALGLADPSDVPRAVKLKMGHAQCNASVCVAACKEVDVLDDDEKWMETLHDSLCVDVRFHRHLDYRRHLIDISEYAPHLCGVILKRKDGTLVHGLPALGTLPALAGYVRALQRVFRGVDDDARFSLLGGPRRDFKLKAVQPAGCAARCEFPEFLHWKIPVPNSSSENKPFFENPCPWCAPGDEDHGSSLALPLVVVHLLRRLMKAGSGSSQFTAVDVGCNKAEFTHQIDELWGSASMEAFYSGVSPKVLEQAGVGFTTPPLTVHCIEAIGTTARELQKMQDNGFLTRSVKIHQIGISDGTHGDEAEFQSLGYGDTVGTLMKRPPLDGRPMVLETVRMTTLDEFAAAHEIPKIHILKIDTEGNDARVLLGASELLESRRIDVLIFEYGFFWLGVADPAVFNLENTVEFLASFGYVSYLLTDSHAIRLDGACWRLEFESWPESADILAVRDDFEHHCKLVRMLNVADP